MALSNPFSVNSHILFCCVVMFFSCYLTGSHVYAAKPYHVVNVHSLLPDSNCTPSTGGSKFGSQKLQVTYKYGPCSPISKGKKVRDSSQILRQDKIRVDSINLRSPNSYPTEESGAGVPTQEHSTGGGDYLVTIGFGTPIQKRTVIIDTGSDITWIQCKPCSSNTCYPQDEPLFDPSVSTSYTNGSCMPNHDEDTYEIKYLDRSYSNGLYGCDTVTIDPSAVITNFQFGCAKHSSDNFSHAAGMLGLGKGDLSLVSQTASKFGKSFTYCFPPTQSTTGYLLFGDEAKPSSSSSPLKFTPLLEDPQFYTIQLVGITVGSKRLSISPTIFSSDPGTIIDSGTVITHLPEAAYSALRSAFKEWMSRYPTAPPAEILDTCYNLSGYENVIYPNIVFHFGGGTDVNLDKSGIVWVESQAQVCLAFAAKEKTSDWNIIGNHQQKALNIFYDIKGGRLGFGTEGCNK